MRILDRASKEKMPTVAKTVPELLTKCQTRSLIISSSPANPPNSISTLERPPQCRNFFGFCVSIVTQLNRLSLCHHPLSIIAQPFHSKLDSYFDSSDPSPSKSGTASNLSPLKRNTTYYYPFFILTLVSLDDTMTQRWYPLE